MPASSDAARRLAAAKRRGRQAENQVAGYLQQNGYPNAERRRLRGTRDAGDIAGVPGAVIEVKNEKRITLAGYLAELDREMEAADAEHGLVVIRRRGVTDVGQWYAVASLEVALRGWPPPQLEG